MNSKLFKLKLIGNLLRNEGTYELFRALEISNALEKINLSDNQFHSDPNDPTLINKIIDTLQHNTTIGYYNLEFNNLSDEGTVFDHRIKQYIRCWKSDIMRRNEQINLLYSDIGSCFEAIVG